MWETAAAGVIFMAASGLVIVVVLRVFILKSSREVPVFPLNPTRFEVQAEGTTEESCEWLTTLLGQLQETYVKALGDYRIKKVIERELNSIVSPKGKVTVNHFKFGTCKPAITTITAIDPGGDALAFDIGIRYSNSDEASTLELAASLEYNIDLGPLGSCAVVADVDVSNLTIDLLFRLTWSLRTTAHHYSFCLHEDPILTGDFSVQLGEYPKTLDTPFLVDTFHQNLDNLLKSLTFPNALRWSTPIKARTRREDSIHGSMYGSISSLSPYSYYSPFSLRRRHAGREQSVS
eukprot:TRINITY_DN6698_c0_g1_i1.p1 TRINITY_DN6698_c0_g1~~TRINITY_DN6698_c0_g1_i1.p1  ORF type:complete len:300 (+),score=37.05 TRINITY_DN6698_c0_g1_i1:28-900(+)